MNNISNQIPTMPISSIIDIRDVAQTCIGGNDGVVFSTVDPSLEFARFTTLQYYLEDDLNYFTQLGTLLLNNESIHLQTEITSEASVNEFISDRELIWMITLPDLPNTSDIMSFDNLIQARGYTRCPVLDVESQTDIWAYSRDADTCQAIITSCQMQGG